MIGLDTNVLARFILQDDPSQTLIVNRLIGSLDEKSPGFVSVVVMVELYWVIGHVYRRTPAELATMVENLLRAKELRLERADLVWQAYLSSVRTNADFSDCLIAGIAEDAGVQLTYTFDKAAVKRAGMTLLA